MVLSQAGEGTVGSDSRFPRRRKSKRSVCSLAQGHPQTLLSLPRGSTGCRAPHACRGALGGPLALWVHTLQVADLGFGSIRTALHPHGLTSCFPKLPFGAR